ncbi:hypothetical protein, partial [Brachyspira catarrhinii]|uniref:hypothetical protein n=1 Tax=Brachyspira catarrhinii TaxID=2528966 RepID=UPI00191EDB6B
MDVFSQSDFNWNVTPSNHNTKEFKQLHQLVKETLEEESFIYKFGSDDKEIKDFISNNFGKSDGNLSKVQIDKNNFVNIYSKWLYSVKNSISVDWEKAKRSGIIDADFYLADLLSENNLTLIKKLFVILKSDHYELERNIDKMGFLISKTAHFYDKQKAHKEFWKRYQRPPKSEYWDYIINRRDLLVPPDIRSRKGSFFTPQIWAEKSREYLESVLGKDWQEEYHIWDLAAGTGNLLAGLTNMNNIWASTIDQADVDIMLARLRSGAGMFRNHIFKFDFLNDDFSKLPKGLKKVIDEKPEKLIIYINPPYAEAGDQKQATGTGKNKTKVATLGKVYEKYSVELNLGLSIREIFTQFFIRIYKEIPNCILASFSTLKYVNSSGFINFREEFKAKFLKGFIVPANTFDNVRGNFPIGFLIWDTSKKQKIKSVNVDVFNEKIEFLGKKSFSSNTANKQKLTITQWITSYEPKGEILGYTGNNGPDYQNNKFLKISSIQTKVASGNLNNATKYKITATNLIQISIYLSVRLCIDTTWINNRDQFLYPTPKWETDKEFQNDCLAFTLFHGQNRITAGQHARRSEAGVNHWIPFSEAEVGAAESFDSHFMKEFIDGKINPKDTQRLCQRYAEAEASLLSENASFIPTPTAGRSLKPLKFSKEAKDVFEAGKKLWRHYHQTGSYINVNASYYDIRKYFQGTDANGRMNNKSIDEEYNKLIKDLRDKMDILAKKIEPK